MKDIITGMFLILGVVLLTFAIASSIIQLIETQNTRIGTIEEIGGDLCIYTPRDKYQSVSVENIERSVLVYIDKDVYMKYYSELTEEQIEYFKTPK